MRFPGNCVLVSLCAALMPGNRIRWKRNRCGRWHVFWQDRNGKTWEFYRKGASGRTYLRNLIYVGEVKRVG